MFILYSELMRVRRATFIVHWAMWEYAVNIVETSPHPVCIKETLHVCGILVDIQETERQRERSDLVPR